MSEHLPTAGAVDLALFGRAPRFAEPLHVGRPNVGDRGMLMRRIEAILDRRWLTNDGPEVQELERRLRALLGVRHAVAMCNGTVALEIAIRALELAGEVIVPAYTFVATAHALSWQEITPVFCDVDAETHTLDPAHARALVTSRTSGIIGVHLWGRACRIDELQAVADEKGLALLFDAAHAIGTTYGGRMIGGFGRAEVFSFHATKVVNSFEGGAVTTNDDELAERMRHMRNFGFAGYDDVRWMGTNGKMSEVCAAMGIVSLDSFDEFVRRNKQNLSRYARRLGRLPGLSVHAYDPRERSNHQYVVVEVDEQRAGLDRDALVDTLWADGVRARRYFWPGVHAMRAYRERPGAAVVPALPVTERVAKRVLLLPTGTAVGEPEIDAIAELVETALAHAPEVRARLAETRAG